MSKKMLWLKVGAGVLLAIQCVLIGLSVWLIVAGEATWVSYVNIAGNIAFGAVNVHAIVS